MSIHWTLPVEAAILYVLQMKGLCMAGAMDWMEGLDWVNISKEMLFCLKGLDSIFLSLGNQSFCRFALVKIIIKSFIFIFKVP